MVLAKHPTDLLDAFEQVYLFKIEGAVISTRNMFMDLTSAFTPHYGIGFILVSSIINFVINMAKFECQVTAN